MRMRHATAEAWARTASVTAHSFMATLPPCASQWRLAVARPGGRPRAGAPRRSLRRQRRHARSRSSAWSARRGLRLAAAGRLHPLLHGRGARLRHQRRRPGRRDQASRSTARTAATARTPTTTASSTRGTSWTRAGNLARRAHDSNGDGQGRPGLDLRPHAARAAPASPSTATATARTTSACLSTCADLRHTHPSADPAFRIPARRPLALRSRLLGFERRRVSWSCHTQWRPCGVYNSGGMEDLAPEDLVDDWSDLSTSSLGPGARLGRYELLLAHRVRRHGARVGRAAARPARLLEARRHQDDPPAPGAQRRVRAHVPRRGDASPPGVHHPNVTEIYELGEEGHVLYLAMEWVNGESLVHVAARPKRARRPAGRSARRRPHRRRRVRGPARGARADATTTGACSTSCTATSARTTSSCRSRAR